MTLTDHVRKIQYHAELVLVHADARDYALTHIDLDNIEANIQSVRDHIETLQSKADCAARPPGPAEKFRDGVLEQNKGKVHL